MAKQTGTKSEAVLEILERIGAITSEPPAGWLQTVQEALERKRIQMHPQSIYGVRSKALKELKEMEKAERRANREAAQHEEEEKQQATNGFVSITVADMLVLKEFINEFGGVERVKNALQAFDTLTSDKE